MHAVNYLYHCVAPDYTGRERGDWCMNCRRRLSLPILKNSLIAEFLLLQDEI